MKRIAATLGTILLAGGLALIVGSPTSAAGGTCETVVVNLTDRADSGVKGNTWAVDQINRRTLVCVTKMGGGERWQYKAAIKDVGTFETRAGDSPGGTATLTGGAKGIVSGEFQAVFTANADWSGFDPKGLTNDTKTSAWIATLFPSATFSAAGPVDQWAWTYQTACEKWVNAQAGNEGDITEEKCTKPTPRPGTKPCTAYKSPSGALFCDLGYTDSEYNCGQIKAEHKPVTLVDSKFDPWQLDQGGVLGLGCEAASRKPTPPPATTPPASGGGGGNAGPTLPVTGVKMATLGAAGLGAVLLGAAALVLGRRRRVRTEA